MASNFQTQQRPTVSERRGQRLAPLQTNFSCPTARSDAPDRPIAANRPRPADYVSANGEMPDRVPLQPAKRQSSKTSLRNLFGGRDKSARKPAQDSKLTGIDELRHCPGPDFNPNESRTTVTQSETPFSPSVCNTPKTALSTPTLVMSPTTPTRNPSTRNKQAPSNPPPLSKLSEEEKPPAKEMGWKPPPLFQAYPQAVKHGRLPAPTLSSDAILRIHTAAKGNGSNEETMGGLSQQREQMPEANVIRRKREDKEKKHIRSVSQTIGKTDWTQKIYVVSTSGYILQYAGEGKYDRLPEKMFLLGPRSVAFASDAIPGKHWVLQVSQDSEPDGTTAGNTTTATSTPRPLLARLGFHRSYTRRLTQSLLMVFNDPDEMSSWLLTVRSQIEARGGKKYVTERVFDDGMEQQLRSKTSVRQLVKRDPNRFSNVYLQPQNENGGEQLLRGESALSRQSSFVSNNRHSIVSTTTQTDVTVPPAGSSNSPERFYAATSAPREAPVSPAVRNGLPQDEIPVLSGPKKRQSTLHMSSLPPAEPEVETPQPSRSQSPMVRSASPPAPNFSVPSFSQRFAAKSGMTQMHPLQLASSQASQFNGEGEGEGEDDYYGTNAFAAFPSPPQSPQRSFSSMSRPDLNELYGGGYVSRQSSLARRPLRVSSSQDSLATTDSAAQQQQVQIQIQDRKPSALTRPPRGSMSTATSSSRPSRPISIISGSDISEAQEPPLQSLHHQASYNAFSNRVKGETQARSRRDPLRGRTSILSQTNNTNNTNTNPTTNYSPMPRVSRRKSTPGLGIGPPALPPPNCPLPKIPSPEPADQYPSPTSSTTNVADLPGRAISPEMCMSPPPASLFRERSGSATSNGFSSRSNHPRYTPLGIKGVSTSTTRRANANMT